MMQKSYEIFAPDDIEIEYVYFSRKSIRQALLYKCDDYKESIQYLSIEKYISLGKILEYYGYSKEEREEIARENKWNLLKEFQYTTLDKNVEIKNIYKRLEKEIKQKSRKQKEYLLKYLNQINFYGDCAIVDIGWHGSMQYYLEKFCSLNELNVNMHGYYVGIMPNVLLSGSVDGYIYNSQNPKLRKSLLCFFGVLEKLFQSTEGSTYTVMLGFMTTDTDVGYYNAAVKIKVILVSVVTSLGTVLLPRASYYIQRGELKEFHRITRKALNFVFLMATPLFVYFIYFAKEGIFFLSGNNYVGSIIPMQVIMPTLLLIGITNILGIQILVPTGREKIVLYSEIVGAVVDVIINALLIPVYASTGAAIGTLVAEFAVFVVQFYALKDEILNTFRQIHYIKILIALSVGSIVSLWVKILNLECFFSLVISSLLFFGAYGFVLLILKEELFVEIFNTIKNKII
ncbi:hypothetical protein G5B03_08490 [Blautia massiliensis]|nr:hypothetical protein [Blautia massiliensis (ex Durand et al. 2017)]